VQKLKEEAASSQKQAVLDKQLELEKMTNLKMAEIDDMYAQRVAQAEETEKSAAAKCLNAEEALQVKIRTLTEEIGDLEHKKSNLEAAFDQRKDMQKAEVEAVKITEMDNLAKLKLEKLQEIEQYLDSYKEERLTQIQQEFDKKISENEKSVDELNTLNSEHTRREMELDELAYTMEAERSSFFFKEKRFLEEQTDLRNMLQNETEVHRKEMALFTDARDQHLRILQEQIKSYAQELAVYQEEAVAVGGKTKKELLSTVEFLESRISGLQNDLENKPSDAYLAELEDRIAGLTVLEQENKKQAMRIASLEKDRHNWQVAVNEISKLTEEKVMLEEKLARHSA